MRPSDPRYRDRLSRLTGVDYGDGVVQGYTFDAMGNRLAKTVNGTPEGYTYNNANMLLTRGGQAYTNDAAGNTLTDGVTGRQMSWDDQNRMTRCLYNGTDSRFIYGADGLRRRMIVGTTYTDYLLDGQSVAREITTPQGQPASYTATYLLGPRGPECKRDGNGVYEWYVYDGLGSVVATVNDAGTVVSSRAHDVYGAVRSGGGGTRHKFVGSLGHASDDETGLIYMRARYMDPATGRFVSEDPARHAGNWYCYADDDPVNLVDASGEEPTVSQQIMYWLLAALATVAAALGIAASGAVTLPIVLILAAGFLVGALGLYEDPLGIGARLGLGASQGYSLQDVLSGLGPAYNLSIEAFMFAMEGMTGPPPDYLPG